MRLPPGVSYHSKQATLIARSPAAARIQIDAAAYASNADFRIDNREFGKVSQLYHGDWKDISFGAGPKEVVYSGAVHTGNPKLPNITIVPNLPGRDGAHPIDVLGSTMGHRHTSGEPRVQEVYEFQSHGMLVLDPENGEPELWVAGPGDKVAVPNGCHMTLYNLGNRDEPLVTLDFADPARNDANKDLVERLGPILLGYHDDVEVTFVLSEHYINGDSYPAGVWTGKAPLPDERAVVIPLRARLDLGSLLYAELTANAEVIGRFARLGLHIRRASPEIVLGPIRDSAGGSRLRVSSVLVDATQPGTETYRYFFPADQTTQPAASEPRGIAEVAAERVAKKQALIELEALNRPLVLMVEGAAGDWVGKAYRRVFERKAGLSVFYADDSTWKKRPAWATSDTLREWEVYYDKADPREFACYRMQRPDAVFIVTPDFTHSSIARSWLGKTPLIFVEKPFDSRLANVDDLLVAAAQRPGTAILGLDHWLAYALPLHALKAEIVEHLGGALAEVVFFMAEDRPIERDRDRSLQFGLTLDLFPHCLALLTHFGSAATIDDIRVTYAGQYEPLVTEDEQTGDRTDISQRFRNETASAFRFTFRDDSGSGYRIPCRAVVGKGFSLPVRYLEVTGRNGNGVRLDLNTGPTGQTDVSSEYLWDSLFFLAGDQVSAADSDSTKVVIVPDPYDAARTLRISKNAKREAKFSHRVDRERYARLFEELLKGRRAGPGGGADAVASTLLLTEARDIVAALDRFWQAIQAERPWQRYGLQHLDPLTLERGMSDAHPI